MKYRLVVSGFGDRIVSEVLPMLIKEPWVEHIHWIAEAEGRQMPGEGHPKLTLIDQHQALYPPTMSPTAASDQLMKDTQASTLPMMDRLEKHGPSLSPMRRQQILRRNVDYWVQYIEDHKINGYIGANTPHEITDYLVAEYLKDKKGAVVRYFLQWRTDLLLPVTNYRDLGSNRAGRLSEPSDEELTQLASSTESIISVYRKRERAATDPFYMRKENVNWTEEVAGKRTRRRLLSKIRRLSSLAVLRRGLRYMFFLVVERRWILPKKDKAVRQQYRDLATAEPNLTVSYVYFALHLQPENTTSPLGGIYVEQRLAIQRLLDNLPAEVSIYIKENPKQGYIGRGTNYYSKFPTSDRIKFMPLDFPSITLVTNALAVATITGTVGLEAIWIPKPVLVFGHVYYGDAPGVFQVADVEALRIAISRILNERWQSPVTPEEFVEQLAHRSICVNVTDYYHRNGVVRLSTEVTAKRIVDELRAVFD